jgi:hypothetical protein
LKIGFAFGSAKPLRISITETCLKDPTYTVIMKRPSDYTLAEGTKKLVLAILSVKSLLLKRKIGLLINPTNETK